MKGIKTIQIFIIIFSVLLKNWIFQYFGWQYDIFEDEFDLVLILANIGALILIVILVSILVKLIKR